MYVMTVVGVAMLTKVNHSSCAKIAYQQGVCQVREVREVREKSGNSVFPQKVREKSGNLGKSRGKVRESFLDQQILRKYQNFVKF